MRTWLEWSYPYFLYLGLAFFIIHLLIYGLGIDQSYFGLILVFIGYFKSPVYTWIFILLWLGIILEIINLSKTIKDKYINPGKVQKKPIDHHHGYQEEDDSDDDE